MTLWVEGIMEKKIIINFAIEGDAKTWGKCEDQAPRSKALRWPKFFAISRKSKVKNFRRSKSVRK